MSHVENNEQTPILQDLLSSSNEHRNKRIHFLDNLRITLFLLLVAHHAAQEAVRVRGDIGRLQLVLLSLFSAMNKSCLWSTFFLVSGCSTAIALGDHFECTEPADSRSAACNQTSVDEDNTHSPLVRSKTVKQVHPDGSYCYHFTRHTLFPALRYIIFLQPLLCFCLRPWNNIFESDRDPSRLSGPVLYILFLSSTVYTHLIVRFIKKRWSLKTGLSPPVSTNFSREHEDNFPKQFVACGVVVTTLLIIYTFCSCTTHLPVLDALEPLLIFVQYDTITPDAPLSYIFAYTLGVYLPSIVPVLTVNSYHLPRLILTKPSYPWLCLAAGLTVSWASMAIAQDLSPPLFEHIRIVQRYGRQLFPSGGFNAHTVFFVIWHTFNTLFIPFFTFLAFAKSSFMQQPLPSRRFLGEGFEKRMAIIPYVHMITVLIAVHCFKGLNPIMLTCALTWIVGLLLALPMVLCWPGVGYICRNWLFAMPAMIWDIWSCGQC
ncbi:hypothetical protein CPB83DRAFT_858891 [Crepidotus variabilis]|uniref:Uncharacterized protein n=1 Tax=Crepidotus variabilis TaxID=179855 RepID=A0A9P6EB64_9AGAR|nr:hypothetical protein CPB83DRAFT_858891 [Crepidotus variabilis]